MLTEQDSWDGRGPWGKRRPIPDASPSLSRGGRRPSCAGRAVILLIAAQLLVRMDPETSGTYPLIRVFSSEMNRAGKHKEMAVLKAKLIK